ncbi:YciI family protein [Parahaliea mediterranea]|uniref:YciI family protein n=1 Tax=Parahaliea mediterranea TaxID=651086 RepID=A0A939DJ42_9GAMM|nr:YciI family protein [Parahaliea mediterranea]MBN7798913.1 YciI family protein [Parahaliea mediterranea]
MYYAIICEDVDNSLALRQQARPAHLARIQALVDEGRLLVAGPHPALDTEEPGEAGFTGSLIIAEFDSLEDATTWADTDPYVDAGVFRHVVVKPYKRVLP